MAFSAPMSITVLFAIGDEELSRALVAAHEEAVDAAVAYIEQEKCRVRRGHNGTKEERERGDPRGWEREVRELSYRLLEPPEVVAIPGHSPRRFTTRELLEAEQGIVTAAVKGQGEGVAVVPEVDVLMALAGTECCCRLSRSGLLSGSLGRGTGSIRLRRAP
jgi:hypothetical protein